MYKIERRIGISQTGCAGTLSLRGALDDIIDCCIFQLESLHEFSDFLTQHNLSMFQVHIQADFIKMPAFGENISIATSIYECRNFYGFRNTVIRDSSGAICAATYATGAFVNLSTGKPERLPAGIIDTIPFDPPVRMKYLPRKINIPRETDSLLRTKAPLRRVHENQLDMNGHMNSNWYVSFAEEMLPAGFCYNRLRIEYKNQTMRGEPLQLESSLSSNNILTVEIGNGNGIEHAILEFSFDKDIPSETLEAQQEH